MSLFKAQNSSIKALATVILLAFPAYLFNRCEDENAQARSYPQVRTNPVSGITSNGVTFNGEIFSLGTEKIIEHGFVWDDNKYADITDDKVLLGPESKSGAFSAEIVSSLAKDVEYTVKAFVQTAEHIVYGLPVTFISLGSGAPVVTGIKPDSAAWLDTIRISGRNFSLETNRNLVKLNQTQCKITSGTDTTLFVEVSTGISQINNLVSVEISGNRSELTKDTFRLIPPVIKEFLPPKAYWGDTVKIRGSQFRTFTADVGNSIKLGAIICERVGQFTDSTISFKISNETATLASDLLLKINGISITAKKQFELLPPYFSISPQNGTWGSTLTLTGRFNNLVSKNHLSFYCGNISYIVQPEDILSTSLKSIRIKIPTYFSPPASLITYEAAPFSVTSVDTFHLNAPLITSFSPLSGPSGIHLTIKGKYFHPLFNTVRFAAVEAGILSTSDSVIVVTVPDIPWADKVKIGVTSMEQSAVSTNDFQYLNPKITSVSPLTGTFNDEITIIGENFTSPTVGVGGVAANIVSSASTKIVVQVPVSIDSVPRRLTVTSGSATITSADLFTLLPPQVSSVSPSGSVVPGQDITITGNNFNPEASYNSVLWDIYPLIIKSATKTQIVATLPPGLPRGTNVVKIITGGYTRLSSQSLSVNSQWLRIDAPQIWTTNPTYNYEAITCYGKSVNDFGYIVSEVNGMTFRYDPQDNSWVTYTYFQYNVPYNSNTRMGEVICQDTFYLISGRFYGMEMLYLNSTNGNWYYMPIPSEIMHRSGIAFSLNNKIYFGLDYFTATKSFYLRDPSKNYSWTRKMDFPIEPSVPFTTYFSLNNKGYVVFSDNSVWQYDPDLDHWSKKADFPGTPRTLSFSFLISNFAYLGSGKAMSDGSDLNDLWMYDPGSDSWQLKSNLPIARNSAIAFSIGNKAYIGFGVINNGGYPQNLFDFYEYDPNYPAK